MASPGLIRLKDGRTAVIRRFSPSDARALIEHVNAVGGEGIYIATERLTESPEELVRRLERYDGKRGIFLIAEMAGSLIGSADARRGEPAKRAHTAELGVAIRKEFRGLGVGEALFQELIRWCQDAGIAKMGLSVFATNEPAIRLYKKLGFHDEGRLVGQVILNRRTVDELVMARFL